MDKQLTPQEILKKTITIVSTDPLYERLIILAMTEYANQQTAALQSRVVELEEYTEDLEEQITEYQQKVFPDYASRIAELERENETANKYIEDVTAGYDKLMGLLEDAIKLSAQSEWYKQDCDYLLISRKDFIEERWQSHCKEHGL